MTFWQLIVLEGLLLLAAGMTIVAGIRGVIGASLILTSLIGLYKLDKFWKLEIPLLLGAAAAIIILVYFSRRAGKSEWIMGLAGGIVSLVVFGAFFTPILALIFSALIMGTGLIPQLRSGQVLWGITPILWRTFLGIAWIIWGNLII